MCANSVDTVGIFRDYTCEHTSEYLCTFSDPSAPTIHLLGGVLPCEHVKTCSTTVWQVFLCATEVGARKKTSAQVHLRYSRGTLWHECLVILTGAGCLTSMHTGSARAFLCEVIKLQPSAWAAYLTKTNPTIAATAKPSHMPGNRSCVGVSFGRMPHCCHCDIVDAVSSCRAQGGTLSTGLCSSYGVECSSYRPSIAMIKLTGRIRERKRACHSLACRFVGSPKTMSPSRKKTCQS